VLPDNEDLLRDISDRALVTDFELAGPVELTRLNENGADHFAAALVTLRSVQHPGPLRLSIPVALAAQMAEGFTSIAEAVDEAMLGTIGVDVEHRNLTDHEVAHYIDTGEVPDADPT
jgi:hypothetical protein